ncbi:uncharacterized protein LOC120195357 [Hibiscus syriacus]|uniref:uncharacterized protein LOC120195357 n=1 Tax=Hibiscus syriacus TaxID=106335 RepID=UPI001920D11F|nr:uncharacterized protein LOC120195357 [Hibiscus syriacus]
MENCVHNGMDINVVQNDNPTELCPNPVPQFQGSNGGFHQGSDDFNNFMNYSASGPDFGDCITMESPTGRKSFNKRKTETVVDDKCKDKRIKGEMEMESESKTKCSTDVSRDSSMENSKAQQKPDYIHVRARRGQATDIHSLAERARREKISKKMKCLQDLVPGCNNITGKGGMLDEIINYVQSLHKQVEFLSMKLAALNPTVEFNVEHLQMKAFAAYVAKFPAAITSLETAGLAFLQLKKEAVICMLDATMNPPRTVTEGMNASTSLSIPEQALGSSCITALKVCTIWGLLKSDQTILVMLSIAEARVLDVSSCVLSSSSKIKMFTNKKINVVLDEMNFLLWKQQVLLTVHSHRLERLLTGALKPPPELVDDENGAMIPNEDYEDFVAQDSSLAS